MDAMTATEELALLEAAYTSIITGGAQSYSINNRSITKLDIEWMTGRMEALRVIVDRQANGGVRVAQMRTPE
jgi:hypothetical protein